MKKETNRAEATDKRKDANRDPLSGTPGAHPVGTGVGAAGGGAAGAAIGATAGPVGAAVGLAVGAIAGGLAGKAVAEQVDPTVEDEYWRESYPTRSYAESDLSYEDYQPAYRVGYEGYNRYPGRRYEDVESELERDYENSKGGSTVPWEKAKYAARDAWRRIENTVRRDTDAR